LQYLYIVDSYFRTAIGVTPEGALTIHLMGNKVLGLTLDVGKTKVHFSSSNEMFGTLISGIGLDTPANNSFYLSIKQ